MAYRCRCRARLQVSVHGQQQRGRVSRARRRKTDGPIHCSAAPATTLNTAFREAGNIDPECIPDLKDDCVLFYHPSCRDLAEKVAAASSDVELGQINWGCAQPLSGAEQGGTHYASAHDSRLPDHMRGQACTSSLCKQRRRAQSHEPECRAHGGRIPTRMQHPLPRTHAQLL
jgi:hypothetical protein